MSIRFQIYALVVALLLLWCGSLIWFGASARSHHDKSIVEVMSAFRDQALIGGAMRDFDAVEQIRERAMSMTEWTDAEETRARMESHLVAFWAAIADLETVSNWRSTRSGVMSTYRAADAWERDVRLAMGLSDGRIAPIESTLHRRATVLRGELGHLLELIRGETGGLLENDGLDLVKLLGVTIVVLGLVSALAASVAMFVANRITRRVAGLEGAMLRMAEGDLEVALPDAGRNDEIGRMASALDVFRRTSAEARRLTRKNAEVERRLIEEQAEAKILEMSLAKERETNSLQRNFVALVSHEFRTPLAIIDGTVQRVARKSDAPMVIEKMDRVRASVRRLIDMIESVLSVSTLDEGKIGFEPARCDLRQLVTEICGSQQEISPRNQVRVELDALPDCIEADVAHLNQVFTNLLSNAVKYSPDGGDVLVRGGLSDGGVRIEVRDSGVGIPADDLQHLFTRFFRASTSTGIAGTGIGLHLVRALVEMHGGAISVSSVEGEGSCFSVELPLAQTGRSEGSATAQDAA